MAITDADLAQECARLYDATDPLSVGGIVYSLVKIGDALVLVERGSVSLGDWMRDFNALPVYTDDLGLVHRGFYQGFPDFYDAVKAQLAAAAELYITGHSLGGAHARVTAAKCACDGIKVKRLVTFGSPRPAYVNLRRVIEKSGMEHVSYRNRNDPVPGTPFKLPELDLNYEHTEANWIGVDSAPDLLDLEPLRDHHIALYEDGTRRLLLAA